jgi:hypothetical protein
MATKASLEITKGGTLIDPVPLADSAPESISDDSQDLLRPFPNEEDWATLPRVAGSIPWTAWTVASVEFVERFSYYGTSAVCMTYFFFTPCNTTTDYPYSCQLHPEGSSSWVHNWCWFSEKARIWSIGSRTACFHWSHHL